MPLIIPLFLILAILIFTCIYFSTQSSEPPTDLEQIVVSTAICACLLLVFWVGWASSLPALIKRDFVLNPLIVTDHEQQKNIQVIVYIDQDGELKVVNITKQLHQVIPPQHGVRVTEYDQGHYCGLNFYGFWTKIDETEYQAVRLP